VSIYEKVRTFGRTATPHKFFQFKVKKKKIPKSDFKELFDSARSSTIECLMSRHIAEIFLLHLAPSPTQLHSEGVGHPCQ